MPGWVAIFIQVDSFEKQLFIALPFLTGLKKKVNLSRNETFSLNNRRSEMD
jgi:hypothetical protein